MTCRKSLVILSGVSTSGKTTLLKNLDDASYKIMLGSLGISNPKDYKIVNAKELRRLRNESFDYVIVHYDSTRRRDSLGRYKLLPELLELNLKDIDVHVLTFCASQKILVKRVRQRIVNVFLLLFKRCYSLSFVRGKWSSIISLIGTISLYKQELSNGLGLEYTEWDNFISKYKVNHIVIDSGSKDVRFFSYSSVEDFMKILRKPSLS